MTKMKVRLMRRTFTLAYRTGRYPHPSHQPEVCV